MASHNLFKISNFRINLKDQKFIELMIQETNIPGLNIGILEMPYQSLKDKRPGDSLEYNNLSLTVLLDEKLESFKEMYKYCILSHDPDTNKLELRKQIFDATLFLTTNKNNIQHKITFIDAWIQSFSDIQLQSTSEDDSSVTMQLEIVYNYYYFE